MSNPERVTGTQERGIESASQAAAERAAELHKTSEQSGEKSPENTENRLAAERKEVEAAFSKEQGSAERKSASMDSSPVSSRKTTDKKERKASYKKTMKRVQSEMTPGQRAFSKAIHNPIAEKTSDIIGGTLARPDAVLAGSLSAFVVVTAVYVIAKNYGYQLSGFETMGAFIIGWILGQLFDFMRTMITGKR